MTDQTGTHHTDADARFIGRIMLLGGSWADKAVDLLHDRALVIEVADLTDEERITPTTVQAILLDHGYAQKSKKQTIDWVDDPNLSAAETLQKFDQLNLKPTTGPTT